MKVAFTVTIEKNERYPELPGTVTADRSWTMVIPRWMIIISACLVTMIAFAVISGVTDPSVPVRSHVTRYADMTCHVTGKPGERGPWMTVDHAGNAILGMRPGHGNSYYFCDGTWQPKR